MKRVYHTWEKWECYPAGLYEDTAPRGLDAAAARVAYADFLRDPAKFRAAALRVVREWPMSCEHYLTNERMNRIAWIGQASACLETQIPAAFRSGFFSLSPAEQDEANNVALEALNFWLTSRGDSPVSLDGAGVSATVNIY